MGLCKCSMGANDGVSSKWDLEPMVGLAVNEANDQVI